MENLAVLAASTSQSIMESPPPPPDLCTLRGLAQLKESADGCPALFRVLSEAGYGADAGEEEGTVDRKCSSAD